MLQTLALAFGHAEVGEDDGDDRYAAEDISNLKTQIRILSVEEIGNDQSGR